MYFYGEGTVIDKKKATYWIEQAHNNGEEDAKKIWENLNYGSINKSQSCL